MRLPLCSALAILQVLVGEAYARSGHGGKRRTSDWRVMGEGRRESRKRGGDGD